MPNYDFTSPLFLTLLVIYFVTFSIRAYDVGILHSIREGIIVRPLGSWVGIVHWIGWASAIGLVILNWKYALIVLVIRFILRMFGILQIIGFALLYPFLVKVPDGVKPEHLEAAKAMFIVCDKSVFGFESPSYINPRHNTAGLEPKIDYAYKKFEQLELNETTLGSILNAVDYLRGDDFVRSEAEEFYQYEKERREGEERRLREEKEWEARQKQRDEDEQRYEEEIDRQLRELAEEIKNPKAEDTE